MLRLANLRALPTLLDYTTAARSSCLGCTSARYWNKVALDAATKEKAGSSRTVVVLYRGRGIQIFRILVRFKVFQLAGVAALAVPIATFLRIGELSTLQTVVAASLIVGSGAASSALWYYSRRYVGELSLLTGQNRVRFSVLDFWGNRENVDVPVADVMPPLAGLSAAAATAVAAEPVLPVTVHGDRQYILSLRYGHVIDGKKLRALLDGSLHNSPLDRILDKL
jgi:TMEM70/TMEM186/TMEM223 protein family